MSIRIKSNGSDLHAINRFAAIGDDDHLGAGHGQVHREQMLVVDAVLGKEDSAVKT